MLPADFQIELRSLVDLHDEAEKRLRSLRDFAEHEGLPARLVGETLGRKASVARASREALAEIPQKVAAAAGAAR